MVERTSGRGRGALGRASFYNRIFFHVGSNFFHRSRKTLSATLKPGEQFFVVDSIPSERHEFDAPVLAVQSGFDEKFFDHPGNMGLLSYFDKDYPPIAKQPTG